VGDPHLLIVFDAAGFIVNGRRHGTLPSAAHNVVGSMIGGFALWRIVRRGSSSTSAM
jgi:hypothetical protein